MIKTKLIGKSVTYKIMLDLSLKLCNNIDREVIKMSLKFEATSARNLLISFIKDYMESNKVTRMQLSKKLNVNPSYVTRILDGKTNCSVDTLLGVADVLGLDIRFYRKGIDKKK